MSHIVKYGQFEKDFLNHSGALIAGGELHGLNTVLKFGHNDAVDTSFAVVSSDGVYRCPIPANAVNIRIKAGGHINDDVDGLGAQQITIEGLDNTGTPVVEVLDTAGVDASAPGTVDFMRVYRAYVSRTGNYPNTMLGNGHFQDIILESTAGVEWAFISKDDVAHSQTQIAAYTFGLGQRGYLMDMQMFIESTKVVDFLLVARSRILTAAGNIAAHRLVAEFAGVEGATSVSFGQPVHFKELTDIAVLARVAASTAQVSVQMTFLTNTNPGE